VAVPSLPRPCLVSGIADASKELHILGAHNATLRRNDYDRGAAGDAASGEVFGD
jgi:hypothetical protein